MNLQVEPPQEKKKKKKIKNSSPPSFSLLPDEIAMNCLARISRSYYPTLSVVSKSFRSIISSTELYAARSHIGTTEQCLYVCIREHESRFPQWFTLWINPNRTLPDSMIRTRRRKKKKKTIGQLLVPITYSKFPSLSVSTVVGSELYIIGRPVYGAPSSAVRVLDCRSHTWRDAPSMNVARRNPHTCAYNGKIYVMGGCEDESWAEVFDTKTQVWERLPDPDSEIRKCLIYKIAEIEGKLNFGNHEEMYAYDTKHCRWEKCVPDKFETVARLKCMIENVSYSFNPEAIHFCLREFQWYDEEKGYWKGINGLNSLFHKFMKNGGSMYYMTHLVSCGGKLIFLWPGYMKHNPNNTNKIWCAVIVVEKRRGSDGDEVWGNVEWVDVVHTVPISCDLLECIVVSV
ncbi:PREDICTED: F-box/kelch-repeat protein At4g19865-like [Camelina sativa]|uniref:F-box/kelch-repeat protein At4g19865-like n=1 Tax=Camelina sativa TaxID=90675 RepID=A0ABM0W9W1_CAMSA|nr:PREDICTED: F-box/kelch-repeat protein At4g19865-like [Camelina sativa]